MGTRKFIGNLRYTAYQIRLKIKTSLGTVKKSRPFRSRPNVKSSGLGVSGLGPLRIEKTPTPLVTVQNQGLSGCGQKNKTCPVLVKKKTSPRKIKKSRPLEVR